MNYRIENIPERTGKPRTSGLTMVMDKGLSLREVTDFIENGSPLTDLVKLGWATSYLTPKLKEKLVLYREAGLPVYFGGTLFEAFVVRGQFEDYRRLLDEFEMTHAEVSDGSADIPHDEKCRFIEVLSKQVTVISEVGSKDDQKIIPPYKWIKMIQAEMQAGSWRVIAEARESGTAGIFRSNGEVRPGLIDEILSEISPEKIIWEAPQKSQQVWFVKLLGTNVNLGNIAPHEIIPLETLRLGLRGDTFSDFLKKNVSEK